MNSTTKISDARIHFFFDNNILKCLEKINLDVTDLNILSLLARNGRSRFISFLHSMNGLSLPATFFIRSYSISLTTLMICYEHRLKVGKGITLHSAAGKNENAPAMFLFYCWYYSYRLLFVCIQTNVELELILLLVSSENLKIKAFPLLLNSYYCGDIFRGSRLQFIAYCL